MGPLDKRSWTSWCIWTDKNVWRCGDACWWIRVGNHQVTPGGCEKWLQEVYSYKNPFDWHWWIFSSIKCCLVVGWCGCQFQFVVFVSNLQGRKCGVWANRSTIFSGWWMEVLTFGDSPVPVVLQRFVHSLKFTETRNSSSISDIVFFLNMFLFLSSVLRSDVDWPIQGTTKQFSVPWGQNKLCFFCIALS